MRLVSGGDNGQAYLWDLNQTEGNGKYQRIYEIGSGTAPGQTQSGPSHNDRNGWASMTWSSDGNCLASVRQHSKGEVTLTHIKKVSYLKSLKFVDIILFLSSSIKTCCTN